MAKKSLYFLILLAFMAVLLKHQDALIICFGLAIFLYAMSVLESSFKLMAGGILEIFLKKVTSKLRTSFAFGLLSTAIMQSSGLVSVLTISFLSASLITLSAGLSIIFGANLGTTTGAWLIAAVGFKVDIATSAMPLIILGVLLSFTKDSKIKGASYFLLSIGLILFGISYMKDGFEGIKSTLDLSKYAISGFLGVIVYSFVGIVITALMQSSHATLILTLAALGSSQISYENALSIAIGSNVGSTVMAVIGSINANAQGKKLVVAHVAFNVVSALIAISCFKFFVIFVDFSAAMFGIANDDYLLKLALFHTYFNLVGVCIFYPLNFFCVRILDKIIKTPNKIRDSLYKSIYINDESLKTSQSAKAVLFKEILHLNENMYSILSKVIGVSSKDFVSKMSVDEILQMRNKPVDMDFDELYEDRFKEIYNNIVSFSINALKKYDDEFFANIEKASLYMAASLKNARNLQTNIFKFMNSKNPFIFSQYGEIRAKCLKAFMLLSEILLLDNAENIRKNFIKLSNIKEELNEISFRGLNKLLGDKKISSSMATSLMNDCTIAWDTIKELVKATEIIANERSKIREI